MEEGLVSDRVPRIEKRKGYDRLIPEGRIYISHGNAGVCNFLDINDAPSSLTESIIQYRRSENLLGSGGIFKGQNIGKQYKFFVFHEDKLVGMYGYIEFLDNPHGFGLGDFFSDRYVMPDYRQTNISRSITSDITYMLFISGVANRTYAYLVSKSFGEFLERNDESKNPCLDVKSDIDGPDVQKHLSIQQELDDNNGNRFLIWVSDGKAYNEMDLENYHYKIDKALNKLGDKDAEEIKNRVKDLINNQNKAVDLIKGIMKMESKGDGN